MQARAAGVLIEFAQDHSYGNTPIVTDQAMWRGAGHPRTVQEVRVRLAAKGKRKRRRGRA